ncbi:TPA: ash family protein [Pseudomonas aeruginosa]|nr:ash family protein [Pseudomonas aeruginosa]
MRDGQQTPFSLAAHSDSRYCYNAVAKSAARRENRFLQKARSANLNVRRFFMPLVFMAAVRGQASAWPGSFCPGFSPRVQSATFTREKVGGGSC